MKFIAQREWMGVAAIMALCMASTSRAEARAVDIAPLPVGALASAEANLVWSSNGFAVTPPAYPYLGPTTAEIVRIGKTAAAGTQTVLHHEDRGGIVAFGSLAYARENGVPYVYFVANYDWTVSYIKRVPLAGGAATIVSRVPFVGTGDLKTDGAYLYWGDKEGVRRMPLAGGTITTLFRSNSAFQIGLDANYVYFNGGLNGTSLHRVPKAGGAVTLQVVTDTTLTDLYVHEAGGQTTVYWTELGGAVSSRVIGSTTSRVYRAGDEQHSAIAVAFDGTRVLWSDCVSWTWGCSVRAFEGGATYTVGGLSDEEELRSPSSLVAEATQVFWGSDTHLTKYVYTPPPSVVIHPDHIYGLREGRGAITRTATPIVSAGDGPFTYAWSASNGAFHVHGPSGAASVWATLAACDTLEATIQVTITDAIGRSASATAEVEYTATRPAGGVCD